MSVRVPACRPSALSGRSSAWRAAWGHVGPRSREGAGLTRSCRPRCWLPVGLGTGQDGRSGPRLGCAGGPEEAQRPAGGGQRRARKPETSGATWPCAANGMGLGAPPRGGGPAEARGGRAPRPPRPARTYARTPGLRLGEAGWVPGARRARRVLAGGDGVRGRGGVGRARVARLR